MSVESVELGTFGGAGLEMSVARSMDAVREDFLACRLMAYADLSAGMILAISAETSRMQEEVNALCQTAVETLSGRTTECLTPLFAEGNYPGVYDVVIMDVDEVGVFLKSTAEPSDAFCCVCAPGIPLSEFIPAARAALDALGAA